MRAYLLLAQGFRFADCEPAPVVEAPAPKVVEAPAPVVEAPPAPAPVPQNVPFRVSMDAFFDFDKATLRPEGKAALDELAHRLAVTQYDTLTIVGHADRIGPAAYNQKLSERRASAIRDYLVAQGIEAEKIAASGIGESEPTRELLRRARQAPDRLPAARPPRRAHRRRQRDPRVRRVALATSSLPTTSMESVMYPALRIRSFLFLLLAAVAFGASHAAPAKGIDEEATAALNALYAQAPGAKALGEKAKAVLVFPSVFKAALLVGGQGGKGAMFQDGRIVGHYNIGGIAVGLEGGAQTYSYALFFMSDEAVERLKTLEGFELGLDPNIVVLERRGRREPLDDHRPA